MVCMWVVLYEKGEKIKERGRFGNCGRLLYLRGPLKLKPPRRKERRGSGEGSNISNGIQKRDQKNKGLRKRGERGEGVVKSGQTTLLCRGGTKSGKLAVEDTAKAKPPLKGKTKI